MHQLTRRLVAALARRPDPVQTFNPGGPVLPPVAYGLPDARLRTVARLVASRWLAEARKPIGHRDTRVMELCEDIRAALYGTESAAVGDPMPLPYRYPVPVVPGPDGAEYPAGRS